MEFHIDLADPSAAFGAVERVLLDIDPTAVVDIDPMGKVLRVSASVTAAQLVELVGRSGYPLAAQQIVQLPSICCGGCSG